MIDEDLIIELWDLFKEYIPEKNGSGFVIHFYSEASTLLRKKDEHS